MDRRISARTVAVSTLVVALAWLNLYQYFSKLPPPRPERAPQPPGAPTDLSDDQKVVDRFHELSYDQQFVPYRYRPGLHFNKYAFIPSRWLGVMTLQNPNDVWLHQEIIAEQKPDFILETGTHLGGGTLLWATILAQVNPEGRVITVDIEDRVAEAKDHPLWKKVDRYVGSSTDPKIVADVARRVEGKTLMVILDSDHSMKHVLAELKLYAPMVAKGGYVIVQDSNINGHPVMSDFGPGPYEAIEAFLTGDDRFASDRARERFLFTMHPKGYLKRVK